LLTILYPEWEKDINLQETPARIAKMYVNEVFRGLFDVMPKITVFDNIEKYNQMVVLQGIQVKSMCSHHFMPFFGQAYIGYVPDKKVVGVSKLSRIVDHYARRPQLQENLTAQIAKELQNRLDPLGVIVVIKAQHLCMMMRGVQEPNSLMTTSQFSGVFEESATRTEFFNAIGVKNG